MNDLCPFCGKDVLDAGGVPACSDPDCQGRSGWAIQPGRGLIALAALGGADSPPPPRASKPGPDPPQYEQPFEPGADETVIVDVEHQGQHVQLDVRRDLVSVEQGQSAVRELAHRAYKAFEKIGGVSLPPMLGQAWLGDVGEAGVVQPVQYLDAAKLTETLELGDDAPLASGRYPMAHYWFVALPQPLDLPTNMQAAAVPGTVSAVQGAVPIAPGQAPQVPTGPPQGIPIPGSD